MAKDLLQDISQCLETFLIDGTVKDVSELKKGHIHDTFVSEWSTGRRYIHQRVNQGIFSNVPGLMSNIKKVTDLNQPYFRISEILLRIGYLLF